MIATTPAQLLGPVPSSPERDGVECFWDLLRSCVESRYMTPTRYKQLLGGCPRDQKCLSVCLRCVGRLEDEGAD